MKSEVYNQSTCLVSQIAYQYYIEEKKRSEIAEYFELSPATISRVLKRAKQEGIIQISLSEPYMECNQMEKELERRYGLKSVCIVPLQRPEHEVQNENVKKQVALEGARYLQRIIRDDDIVGLAWGGTMYHLIHYLNPCRKTNASIITMHGSIAKCNKNLEVKELVKRAAMAFGGHNISLEFAGLQPTVEQYEKLKNSDECKRIFDMYHKIDISVTGVGCLCPDFSSLLAQTDYLSEQDIDLLKQKKAISDVMLRFVDIDGKECETSFRDRTLSIDYDTYRRIPCKIVVASGSDKEISMRSLLNGKLVDVLIIDYHLAKKLMQDQEQDFCQKIP